MNGRVIRLDALGRRLTDMAETLKTASLILTPTRHWVVRKSRLWPARTLRFLTLLDQMQSLTYQLDNREAQLWALEAC